MTKQKRSKVYSVITDVFIKALKEGIIPWIKPWSTTGFVGNVNGHPMNIVSKTFYRGVNYWLAAIYSIRYGSPFFITEKQALKKGVRIKKEHYRKNYCPITYWLRFVVNPNGEKEPKMKPQDLTDDMLAQGYKVVTALMYYRVYNITQTEEAEKLFPEKIEKETNENATIEACEAIVNGYKNAPEIKHEGSRAFYQPSTDTVTMPKRNDFKSSEHYYGTLFHELVHSTGSTTRLKREDMVDATMFGDHAYSKEELTAEIGSAFLRNVVGIESDDLTKNSKAYIQGWIKQLEDDEMMIYRASKLAQEATEHILGEKFNIKSE